nr:MAG TPA: hypothetical protein [Caudoviricetes sp.]
MFVNKILKNKAEKLNPCFKINHFHINLYN